MRVDGPYGEAEGQPDYVHYPVLVMFAGGIGVREASSVLKLQFAPFNHQGDLAPMCNIPICAAGHACPGHHPGLEPSQGSAAQGPDDAAHQGSPDICREEPC